MCEFYAETVRISSFIENSLQLVPLVHFMSQNNIFINAVKCTKGKTQNIQHT